jgi:hypothetical protein
VGEAYLIGQASFNGSVRIETRQDRLTSDAGVLLMRELLEKLRLIDWLTEHVDDPRDPDLTTHALSSLLRARLLMLCQGWRDADDIDLLREDPAFRLSVSDDRGVRPLREDELPSVSTVVRLTAMLSSDDNLPVLQEALTVCAGRSRPGRPATRNPVVVDFDSIPVEVHGQQPGSAFSGQYGYRAYHPLIASVGEDGDVVGAWLRPGNAHTAEWADELIPETVARVQRHVAPVHAVRFDAGFPSGHLFEVLDAQGIHFLARIRCNSVIDGLAGWRRLPMLPPPTDEPRIRFQELLYKAGSWSRAHRVVHVHIQDPGDLVGRDFFLVTSFSKDELPAPALLQLYRRRGLAEDGFGQWLDAFRPALSSTNRPKSHVRGVPVATRAAPVDPTATNEVTLLLSALAQNLTVALRRLDRDESAPRPRLRNLREHILKVGARVTISARRVTVLIAGSANDAWKRLWTRLATLPPWTPQVIDST